MYFERVEEDFFGYAENPVRKFSQEETKEWERLIFPEGKGYVSKPLLLLRGAVIVLPLIIFVCMAVFLENWKYNSAAAFVCFIISVILLIFIRQKDEYRGKYRIFPVGEKIAGK